MAIQLFMPKFDVDACLDEIRECLKKGWTGMGFKTVELEEKWKEYPGVHYIDNTNYRMYNYAQGTCPKAEYYSEHILSLPLHLRLTEEDVKTVIDAVVEFNTK